MAIGSENTKLVNQMVDGETCYFRPSGFYYLGSREHPIRLHVEKDFRVWITAVSHNTIPIKLVGNRIQISEQYRSVIEREIRLGGGFPFVASQPLLEVDFV